MFGRSYRVATIGGVPVYVDGSWIWIALFITYSLWIRFDSTAGTPLGALALAVLTSALFFGSVLCHELAHAFAARLQGITVFGITLVIFGGFTATRADERGPGPAFLVSAVGPAMSLVLGALFWLLSRAVADTDAALASGLGEVAWVNLFMAAFNVLPGLPLDGGRMLQTAVWRISGRSDLGTKVAARAGVVVALGIFAGALFEAMRGEVIAAIWLGIVGSFIFQGARGAETSMRAAARLATGHVRDVLEPAPPSVDAALSLSEALDRFLRGNEELAFPVVDTGNVIGVLTFDSARAIGSTDPLRPVRDAVVPLSEVVVLHPDDPLDAVGARLPSGRTALVLSDGRLVGTLQADRLADWAERRPV